MALRVVEVVVPEREADTFDEVLSFEARAGPWRSALDGGLATIRFVLDADEAGGVVDEIQRRYGNVRGFHLVILPVTAALPRPTEPEAAAGPRFGSKRGGLTREELHTEATSLAKSSRVFYATVVLSTLVVTVGLLKGSVAVIIGAMVIAPLLGPNVALALSTTLGDTKLMRASLQSNLTGILIAFAMSLGVGLLLRALPLNTEILARTEVGLSDILLALAAGSAGALAMTTGVGSALVGVMVAVALLPPTAVVGIMLARGEPGLAGQALLLLCVNVIGVNLAATATFLVQGIQPRRWWQADRARRATLIALGIGVLLVTALALILVFGQGPD